MKPKLYSKKKAAKATPAQGKPRRSFREQFEFDDEYEWYVKQDAPFVTSADLEIGPFEGWPGFIMTLDPESKWKLKWLAERASVEQETYLSSLLADTLHARLQVAAAELEKASATS